MKRHHLAGQETSNPIIAWGFASADEDAAYRQKILDGSEAEAEAMIGPDRIADDLGKKPIAGVARRPIAFHGTSLSVCCPS